jgi:hypothetical protein
MAQAKTFVLKRKKTFRRGVRVFIKGIDGKLTDRVLTFSTDHLVPVKQRKKRARTIAAEYTTSNHEEIEALFCDSAYGKDFFLKGDEEGKLKQATRVVTKMDSEKVALRGLFELIGLPFDESKPIAVLQEMYRIQASAMSGRKIEKGSAPTPIPIEKVDVKKQMAETADVARKIYEDKYGQPVPEEFSNDFAFLSALGDPDFDAENYIAINSAGEITEEKKASEDTDVSQELSIDILRKKYQEKHGTQVPTNKKNDATWIQNKLAE